jgi:His/Glu/Gln/Arg/opine family amino acid ABC transporter permease subunit
MIDLLARWGHYWDYGIASGLGITVLVSVVALITTILWATVITALRVSNTPLRYVAIAYIEFFRSTPLLVQLLTVFTTLPILTGIYLDPFPNAILALTLNAGGYLAESYRSGFEAVPSGQYEAGAAIGLTPWIRMRRVIAPQAFRIILPAIGNAMIVIVLATPFVYLAGLQDLMGQASRIQLTFDDFSPFLLVSLIYVVLGLLLAFGNGWLERRFRLPA